MYLNKNKMKNTFSKILILLVIPFIFFFTSSSNAADNSTYSSLSEYAAKNGLEGDIYAINTSEDVGKDLTKRMILGIFGKDALKQFLPRGTPDSVYDEIDAWNEADIEKYSKPFNSSIISGTLIILSSFFLVALFIMALYIIWLYVEALFRTQDSGEFLGNQWSRVFTPLKVIFGFWMILPIFGQSHSPFNKGGTSEFGFQVGSFSMAQMAVLTFAGQSSSVANSIYGEFARSIPKFYPSIQMPDPATKAGDAERLIDFMLCRRAVSSESIPVKFNLRAQGNSSYYTANITSGQCSLDVKVGYDSSTAEEVKKNKELIALIGNVNYDSLQKSVIKEAITKMINDADVVAAKIVSADLSENMVTDTRVFGSKSYNYPTSGDDWKMTCDAFTNDTTDSMSRDSALKYIEYSSKCLSYNLMKDLSKSSIDTTYVYGNENYLKNKNIELCAKDSTAHTDLMTAKISSSENGMTSRSEVISDCVQRLCSKNLYECSSAINYAKSMMEKEKMAQMGWMTAGANLYRLMSGYDNKAAKNIINNTSVNSTQSTSVSAGSKEYADNDSLKGGVIDTFVINLSESKYKYNISNFNNFIEYKVKNYGTWHPPAQSFWDSLGGSDGILGISKFQNCIENPNKIYNGYLCGNITEELHLFGAKLLALGVQGKIISWASSQNKSPSRREAEGTIKKDSDINTKGVLTSVINYSVYGAVMLMVYDGVTARDGFSTTDSEIWSQYPEMAGLLAIGTADYILQRGDNQVLGQILNLVVNICLALGVIFGFIMPLLPFGIWLVAVSGWLILLLESMVIASIWAVTLIAPSSSHQSEPARRGSQIIISLLLRAPLLTIGLILAWLLNNILISELLQFSDIGSALAINKGSEGLIDQLVMLGVYFIILYGMYSVIFTLIESFNTLTLSLIFEGGSKASPFGKERSESWQGSMSTAAGLLERKAA